MAVDHVSNTCGPSFKKSKETMVEVKVTLSQGMFLRLATYATIIIMYYYIREETIILKEGTSNKYLNPQLPPDQRMFQFFSGEEINRWLTLRHFTYRFDYIFMLCVDSLFAILYGFAGADLLTQCAFRLPETHWVRTYNTVPLIAALFDIMENIQLILLTFLYPTRLPFDNFVWIFTFAKFTFAVLSLILVPVTLLWTYREEKNKFE